MFIKTFKIQRPVAYLIAAAVAAGIGMGCVDVFSPKSVYTSTAAATDNAGRIAFLDSFGWQVEEEPFEIIEIVIPTQFDAVYEEYNTLQKQQGYDLTRYRGKAVRRYTYRVLNYPDYSEDVFANLLIYQDQIIAGDISSVSLYGFMHGLLYECR